MSSSCCKTLRTTDSTRKEATLVATRTGREAVEAKSPNGPATSERRPMMCESQREVWRERVLWKRGVNNKFGKVETHGPLGDVVPGLAWCTLH